MACKMIAYYRVSTVRQGASGLGLEAQKSDVAAHLANAGCDLVAEYTEIETGTKHDLNNRPELRKALLHAKRSKATLVVARLDRLLRSTVVCALLKTSGVPFVCCDNPHANALTIDILAAVAEDEGRRISERTKAALAKSRKKLGGAAKNHKKPTRAMALKGAAVSAKVRAEAASLRYSDLYELVRKLRGSGASLLEISARLDALAHRTSNGNAYSATHVSRILARAERAA